MAVASRRGARGDHVRIGRPLGSGVGLGAGSLLSGLDQLLVDLAPATRGASALDRRFEKRARRLPSAVAAGRDGASHELCRFERAQAPFDAAELDSAEMRRRRGGSE